MMNAREVVELANRAFFQHGLDAFAEFLAADVSFITADAVRIEGREEVVDYLRREHTAFPDLIEDVSIVAVDGPVVVQEGVVKGRHLTELTLPSGQTLPATGREIALELVAITVVANDRISRVRRYYDRLGLMAQLGLMPAPARRDD